MFFLPQTLQNHIPFLSIYRRQLMSLPLPVHYHIPPHSLNHLNHRHHQYQSQRHQPSFFSTLKFLLLSIFWDNSQNWTHNYYFAVVFHILITFLSLRFHCFNTPEVCRNHVQPRYRMCPLGLYQQVLGQWCSLYRSILYRPKQRRKSSHPFYLWQPPTFYQKTRAAECHHHLYFWLLELDPTFTVED